MLIETKVEPSGDFKNCTSKRSPAGIIKTAGSLLCVWWAGDGNETSNLTRPVVIKQHLGPYITVSSALGIAKAMPNCRYKSGSFVQ